MLLPKVAKSLSSYWNRRKCFRIPKTDGLRSFTMASNKNKLKSIELGGNTKPGTDQSQYDVASKAVVAPDEALKNVLTFAKANHLKYKRNNTYCKVCDCKISSSLKRLEEHVEEQSHKDKAAEAAKASIPKAYSSDSSKMIPSSNKVLLTEFIISKYSIEDFLFQEVVINDKICLSFASFETLVRNGPNFRCQTCEVSIDRTEAAHHIGMWQHERGKQIAYVLMQFDTEFVREVRPGVYHCGLCNFIEGSMTGLQNHLKSINHMKVKAFARNRLIKHMPDIIEHRHEQAVRQLLLRGMRGLFL